VLVLTLTGTRLCLCNFWSFLFTLNLETQRSGLFGPAERDLLGRGLECACYSPISVGATVEMQSFRSVQDT